jgi:hypothetical protein
VAPPAVEQAIAQHFSLAEPVDEPLVRELLGSPGAQHQAEVNGEPVRSLRMASDIDRRTFDAAATILRLERRVAVLAVYIGGFDTVAHAFWPYAFPGDFPNGEPVDDDEVAAFGDVVNRYMRFVDQRLGRLLEQFGPHANVVVVSDHGHGGEAQDSLWPGGWHSKQGVFLAAGPDIPHSPRPVDASYFDIVPTILDLAGCRPLPGLSGMSMVAPRL